MADTPISGLSTQGALTADDLFAVVDDVGGTPVTNSVRADIIRAFVAAGFNATGSINMVDQLLQRPLIQDFAIRHSTASSSSGVLTLDYSQYQSYAVTLTENITSIVISNPPASGHYGSMRVRFTQDAVTARTITYGSAYLFPSGTHHAMSTTLGAVDRVAFETIDGGSSWDCTFIQPLS